MSAPARRVTRLARAALPALVAGAAIVGMLAWLRDAADPTSWHDCSPIGSAGAPRVSEPSGFHDDELSVRVQAPQGAAVFATLDGSWPDPATNPAATFEIDGPVTVGDARGAPLRISDIPTQIDLLALADGRLGDARWQRADPAMDRMTVLRARTLDGPECVAVYAVGPQLRRQGIAVAHLATDADHLFDHDTGIYVPGATFADHLARTGGDEGVAWYFLPANYHQSGRSWERPTEDDLERSIVLHWFAPGGDVAYTTNLGVRIHGSSSRGFPQKSLRLYARNDYGRRTFEHAFFGDRAPDQHRRLILRNAGSDCVCWYDTRPKVHMVDAFVHEAAADLGIETMAAEPVVLFVNGEYWGMHLLRERYDQHYLQVTHGVPASDAVILDQRGDVEVGVPGDEQALLDVLELADAWPTDRPGLVDAVEQHVDVDDFVTYLAVELYTGNADWPRNNVKVWRERVQPGTGTSTMPVRDGRWRWLLFDVDGLGGWEYSPDFDRLELLLTPPDSPEARRPTRRLFFALASHEPFRHRLATAIADALNGPLAPERALEALDRLDRIMAPEREAHLARWFSAPDAPDGAARFALDELREFIRERPERLRAHVADHFDLPGTLELEVELVGGGAGSSSVLVNRLAVEDDRWRGTYFRQVPVRLAAHPAPGRSFVRWHGVPEELATEAVIHLTLDGDSAVRAEFS